MARSGSSKRGLIGRPTPEDEERLAAESAATEELHELVSQLGEAEQTGDEITPGGPAPAPAAVEVADEFVPATSRSRRKR